MRVAGTGPNLTRRRERYRSQYLSQAPSGADVPLSGRIRLSPRAKDGRRQRARRLPTRERGTAPARWRLEVVDLNPYRAGAARAGAGLRRRHEGMGAERRLHSRHTSRGRGVCQECRARLQDELADVKLAAAERWAAAVNAGRHFGTWRFAMARSVTRIHKSGLLSLFSSC